MKFAPRMNIQPSATLTINGLALAKRQRGQHVHNFSAGEPMMETPQKITDAVKQAIDAGHTRYGPVAGVKPLREAVRQWMERTWDSSYELSEICITNGGKFALYALCQALLSAEDEALIIAPFWVSYKAMTSLAGATPVIVHTTEDREWKVAVEQLAAVKTEKTKLLFLNNASNPTGVLYTKEEIQAILQWAHEHNIIVISDEVYSGLVYDEQFTSAGQFPAYKQNTIIVQSCSKNFAMTGWRVGVVCGPQEVVNQVKKIQGQSTSNTVTFVQYAAVSAFDHAEALTGQIQKEMKTRRDIFVTTWRTHFGDTLSIPKAGLYTFFSLQALGIDEPDDIAFCTRVLEEANIAMVPGTAFGMPGYVRCSFGLTAREIVDGLQALAAYVETQNT